jgi:hypothetical protein
MFKDGFDLAQTGSELAAIAGIIRKYLSSAIGLNCSPTNAIRLGNWCDLLERYHRRISLHLPRGLLRQLS